MIHTFVNYITGRVYNGEQNLEISLIGDEPADVYDMVLRTVEFRDNSRNITGRIKNFVFFTFDTPQAVGRQVLSMYDKGMYQEI